MIFIGMIPVALALYLATRAISEGWHSGRLQYVLKAKKHGVTI